jgi:ferredoxin
MENVVAVRRHVAKLLRSKSVRGVLSVRQGEAFGPHLFRTPTELEELVIEPRFPMAQICRLVLKSMRRGKLAVVGRGCDERALNVLASLNEVDLQRVAFVGVCCTREEAMACGCRVPSPENPVAGKKIAPPPPATSNTYLPENVQERFTSWQNAFARCIKCYGCRNACPVCVCESCILQDASFVPKGEIPPPALVFHLTRTYHVADKCVSCGECEAACPMDIPLGMLYQSINETMSRSFGFIPGAQRERLSPLLTSLEVDPLRQDE